MFSHRNIRYIASVLLLIGSTVFAQSPPVKKTVVINGHRGEANIYRINGKSYIDLQNLVEIANGTMGFQGEEITLEIPPSQETADQSASSAKTGMSTEFMKSGIEFVSAIKAWTATLTYGVQKGIPGDGTRVMILRERAAEALRLAKVHSSSADDDSSYQLLSTHYDDVQRWSDQLIGERKSMDTGKYSMSAEALEKDSTYQRITTCTKFLSTMIPSGQFQDDLSCR